MRETEHKFFLIYQRVILLCLVIDYELQPILPSNVVMTQYEFSNVKPFWISPISQLEIRANYECPPINGSIKKV